MGSSSDKPSAECAARKVWFSAPFLFFSSKLSALRRQSLAVQEVEGGWAEMV